MRKNTEGLIRITGQNPDFLPQNEASQLAFEAIERLQKIERNYIGRDSISVKINADTVKILHVGDLHLGSIATDHEAIDKLRDSILSEPNTCVILLGDEIEGLTNKYMNTNTARTPIDVHQQVHIVQDRFLKPLAEAEKIIATVGGYWGHPGWTEDNSTVNTWIMMVAKFKIPIIRNGGKVFLKFPNGHEQSMQIWHNPPGKSQYDSVFGLRKVALAEGTRGSDIFTSAHIHRSGVAKELQPNGKSHILISSGTAKGSNPKYPPDRFGVKLGLPLADPLGQGVVTQARKRHHKGKNNNKRIYPFPTFTHGEVVVESMELLDRVESQGLTEELKETIRNQVEPKPRVIFRKNSSKFSKIPYTPLKDKNSRNNREYNTKGAYVRPHEIATYNIQTKLPVALHLISNVRIGSESSGYRSLLKYHEKELATNPHALTVYLRSMLDKGAGSQPEREDYLFDIINLIKKMDGRALALMADESIRQDSWKKEIKEEDGSIYDPIPPGTFIARKTGIPLLHHLSTLRMGIGPSNNLSRNTQYTGAFPDKLQQHASQYRATYGHFRLYDLYMHNKPGFIAGGHVAPTGFAFKHDRNNGETENPLSISPGWWANFVDSFGRASVRPGADPGASIIFMPGKGPKDYLVVPAINIEESKYMHDALLLLSGLKQAELYTKVMKKTQPRKRKK